jgi:hemerythrin-like domain-containing protein
VTEHLTMNTVVHAAFRRTVSRFDVALAQFPDGSRSRADQLKSAWDFFDEELHHHHGYEERFFWPALRNTDADLTALVELDQEHDAMRAALTKATAAMAALQAGPTTSNAVAARSAVGHFGEVLLNHLDHEERDLEPISVAYQSSPPMKAALSQVKKAHLKSMGNFVEFLQDGADPADRAGLRKEIPAPVVFVFGRLAGRRYRRDIAPTWTVGQPATG